MNDREDWDSFVADAAAALPALDEIQTVVPDLVAHPFDATAQQRVRELLDSDRLSRATAAANRIAQRPALGGGI